MSRTLNTGGSGFEDDRAPCSFSEVSLAPLFELNSFFLELLTEAARHPAQGDCAWGAKQGRALSQLTAAARARIARCPVCLADAGFQEEARWDVSVHLAEQSVSDRAGCLPLGRAIEFTQMTVTLAWTVARTSREAACIIFGMTPRCAQVVSALGVHRIPALAKRNSRDIRPAWANHPQIWQHLIGVSDPAPASRLPPVHVRAMQRQLAEVSLATGASRLIQQTHR
jgi:hypothetical protein